MGDHRRERWDTGIAMNTKDGQLFLGTSSWTGDGWVGSFYPSGSKPADFLPHYAEYFNTVEIDSTFYRTPTASTVEQWRERTPKGFIFAAKIPQICCDRSYVVLISDRLFSRGLGMRQHNIISSRRSKSHRAACWRVLHDSVSPALRTP